MVNKFSKIANYFNNTKVMDFKLKTKYTNYSNTKTNGFGMMNRTRSSDNILINNNYYKSLNRISQNRDIKTMVKHIVITNIKINIIK